MTAPEIRVRPGEAGATALEFALIAPVLIFLLFATIETGRVVFMSAVFGHAVRGAARCAAVSAGCTDAPSAAAEIEAAMRRLSAPVAVPADAVSVQNAPCGTEIAARIAYPPLLLPAPGLFLEADACGRAN